MNSHRGSLRRMPWSDPRPLDPRLVDVSLVVACLVLTALAVKTPWAASPWPVIAGSGLAGSVAVRFRRHRPVLVTAIGAATMALSGNPGPLLIALFSAVGSAPRRWYPALAVIGVAGFATPEWVSDRRLDSAPLVAAVVATALVLAVGVHTLTRRQLLASLRERADHAEAERLLRDEHARAGERTRIAREMHDVLAHKVSLISLHAGALEVNPGAEPGRIEQGAALIRVTAQEALEELRDVLGVLRDGPDEAAGPGQPGGPGSSHGSSDPGDPGPFADIARLVESWSEAGATVSLHDELGTLPRVLARTVYRLVQEGLTNAHRHAPGATVVVSVTGARGPGLTVTVTNGPAGEGTGPPGGSGVGLVGLAERLRLLGGTLRSGPDDVGGWRLEGRLPWPAGDRHQRPPDSSRGAPRDQGSAGRR